MSERKVISKYYPPDFDPAAIGRTRKSRDPHHKLATVRLMAPFSMKCNHCGEYIYQGRKFNARKQDTTYLNIPIIRFYIKCTRCSAEMTFITDPKNNDYQAERGMRRNFEPWREAKLAQETEEERLDRLEKEEAERDPMKELEQKAMDAQTEMKIADKLDEIRTRNARREQKDRDGVVLEAPPTKTEKELEEERLEREDAEIARKVFLSATGVRIKRHYESDEEEAEKKKPPVYDFSRKKKPKIDWAARVGIKGLIRKEKPVENKAEPVEKKAEPVAPVEEESFW